MNPQQQAQVLTAAQTIAVVGHSDKSYRTSYRIAQYLRGQGYTVWPVNPTVETIDGARSYPNLSALPATPDIVNVFRRSQYLLGHVEEAIVVGAPVVWAQLGVHDDDAVQVAEAAGLAIITDTCIKVSHARYVR